MSKTVSVEDVATLTKQSYELRLALQQLQMTSFTKIALQNCVSDSTHVYEAELWRYTPFTCCALPVPKN